MPSPHNNRHNPGIDEDSLARLMELRYRRRVTWREFYRWAVPILEQNHLEEEEGHVGQEVRAQ